MARVGIVLIGLAVWLGVAGVSPHPAVPSAIITEIIDSSGDGAGNYLAFPCSVAADGSCSAYVAGYSSHNAFRIILPPPVGGIAEPGWSEPAEPSGLSILTIAGFAAAGAPFLCTGAFLARRP